MDEKAKEAAKREILRARDALLLDRLCLYHIVYMANQKLEEVDRKLSEAKAAGRFFDMSIAVPEYRAQPLINMAAINKPVFDFAAMKEFMDKQTGKNWMPTGFDTAEDVVDLIKMRLAECNIDGDNSYVELSETEAQEKITVADIALQLLKSAGEKGMKSSSIRDYIEKAHNRHLHEKTVSMTLYRLLQDEKVSRSGHTWFIAQPAT